MLHLVLYQPEIPPNTGNIIRLCANTGAILHLVHPLGFELDDRKLRRAGLDYNEFANIHEYDSIEEFSELNKTLRVFAVSTRGTTRYTDIAYRDNDAFLMGPETRGLPQSLLDTFDSDRVLRIPMKEESRSLNLSNAAAIIVYEAWRQVNFAGS